MQNMKRLVVALWAAAWMGCGAEGGIEVPLRTADAGAADVGVDPRCPTGQLTCGGTCVDPRSNALHCGACGRACASAASCVNGACQVTCPMGQAVCDDRCVDLQSNALSCGACGRPCGAGEGCAMGACVRGCPSPRATCGGQCVDLLVDAQNCGACGRACPASQSCTAGACVSSCPSGQLTCGGACVDARSDRANCGACGMTCAAGQSCTAGSCVTMASPIRVEWTFPALWSRPGGEVWLPTYLVHLFGLRPPADGVYQLETACARLTNTGTAAQSVSLQVRAPGYATDRSEEVSVSPGAPLLRCVNPAWNLPLLYALRSLTPMGIEAYARDASGTMLSSAMRSVSALPGNGVVWSQSAVDRLTTTSADTFAAMGPYASVFVTPNDATVTTVRRAVEPRSQYGTFGAIGWNASRQQYRTEALPRAANIPVGNQYFDRIYLEGNESIAWALGTVTGGADADIDVYLFSESQYGAWRPGAASPTTRSWTNQRSGASGTYTASATGGWYRLVLFNTTDNFVSRDVRWARNSTRADVVWDALAAIFNELRSRGVIYRNISSSYFEGYQPISLPRDSVTMRAANCIDGALLFASILENIGFEPVLHLVPGHAYVGVNSAPQSSGVGVTWFIETTMLGDTARSWFDAVLCGLSSCVVPMPAWSVDVSVVDARAARMRPIPY
ncbi:MAG: hypothetical protein EPO40_24270 [Myxococcaceae bacterium]|nr:MAG: hypothetical protein EPO40_24270 [Myxococcaceae bacterium]